MNTEILEKIRELNRPQEWINIKQFFNANPITKISGEPVYPFFKTLTDDLKVNPHSISISVQPVASYIPFHIHNYAEIMIPLLGNFSIQINESKIKVNQNDILLIGKSTAHKVDPIEQSSIVVNIALKDTAFSLNDLNFLRQGGGQALNISNMLFTLLADDKYGNGRYSLFNINHNDKIVYLIYDIISEYYGDEIQSEQIIRSDILSLFSRLIRNEFHNNRKPSNTGSQSNSLLSFLLYIESNYRNITLDKMADHFGFHPNYLSSFLKRETGYTFIKLVHLQRINTAAEMMIYTSAPIEQIAINVGYDNPSYFYKIFKKMMSVSPNEYRKKNRRKVN